MWQAILDLALISNAFIAVVDSSLAVSLVVSILTTIFGSVLGLIVPLAVLVAVDKVALVCSMGLNKNSCIEIELPFPWNLLFSLKVPL